METMTPQEHDAVERAARLFDAVSSLIGDAATASGDRQELAIHIHAIQNMVLAQAAARAYPEKYRLMGGRV